MRWTHRFVILALMVVLGAGCAGHLVYASDLYRGKVVDAETKQPLVGAVVLAIWYREVPVAPHGPAVDYHDALEVLTDAQGEFTIPARTHVTLMGKIREPAFVIYYPGHAPYPSLHAQPQGKAIAAAYEQKRFLVELPRFKTNEERIRVRDLPVSISNVPEVKMPNLTRLVNEERQAVGLLPVRLGR